MRGGGGGKRPRGRGFRREEHQTRARSIAELARAIGRGALARAVATGTA